MSDSKRTKVLTAARSVFLRYGYRRVNMADLAEAGGVSRPALYLLFKNKEEIFISVFHQWVGETIESIRLAMADETAPLEKVKRAFEIWVVQPFEMTLASPEAQELIDCSFGFAKDAQREGYAKFEATIAPVLATIGESVVAPGTAKSARIAHMLASAVRGFKVTASDTDQLRELIHDILALVAAATASTNSDHPYTSRKNERLL